MQCMWMGHWRGDGQAGRMSVGGATVAGMSPDLDALIAEATVDCYGDDERLTASSP